LSDGIYSGRSTRHLYGDIRKLACVLAVLTDERRNICAAALDLADIAAGLFKKVEQILENEELFKPVAERFSKASSIFFIGRGLDYSISLEGSLKLKEISYIKSEADAAGELKHGTISLIEPGTPVFAVATQPDLFERPRISRVRAAAHMLRRSSVEDVRRNDRGGSFTVGRRSRRKG